jgi:putative acetyltransferase
MGHVMGHWSRFGWQVAKQPRCPISSVQARKSHSTMRIEADDLSRPQVHALLREHLAHMHALSPAEHVFALDLPQLRAPDISFWTLWENDELLGCVALKALSATHGEVKSMRTAEKHRGRGAGRALLVRVVETAMQRGYQKLSLETGTHPAFIPAQQLYLSMGFKASGPFADYEANAHSLFMELALVNRFQ